MQISQYKNENKVLEYIIRADETAENIDHLRHLFDVDYLSAKTADFVKVSEGRGQAYFFTSDEQSFVLRCFNRGGLIASVSKNRYLWQGLQRTRTYRELSMLVSMYNMQLPVPKPFAARVRRYGFSYSADLITYRIHDACSLAEHSMSVQHDRWFEIGKVIKQFHDKGIYHADLNAHNILLTQSMVYIIDFDKGEIKSGKGNEAWKAGNIARLQRSLVKLKEKQELHFCDQDWQQLMAGYQSDSDHI